MKKLFTLLAIVLSLQGCVFAAGAAAGAAAIAVVYDHRKIEKIILDQRIASAIKERIEANEELSTKAHINVTCFNQTVLLTGEAITKEMREEAEVIARGTPDVQHVYNALTLQAPSSSLTRTSDAWITTKIKTKMLADKELESSTIKVVTENGTVYLLGIVSRDQADIAVEIARQESGVQKVVRIFQYTN